MRGQPGTSQGVTIGSAVVTTLPDALTLPPTGLLVEVVSGTLWYTLNAGTPLENGSHKLGAGDVIELSHPHRFRVLAPSGASLFVTRFDGTDATRVVRASGSGSVSSGLTDTELRANPVEVDG